MRILLYSVNPPPSIALEFYLSISIRRWPTCKCVEWMRHEKWFNLKKNRGSLYVEKGVKISKTRFHRLGTM